MPEFIVQDVTDIIGRLVPHFFLNGAKVDQYPKFAEALLAELHVEGLLVVSNNSDNWETELDDEFDEKPKCPCCGTLQ